jgi:hypothetical protein
MAVDWKKHSLEVVFVTLGAKTRVIKFVWSFCTRKLANGSKHFHIFILVSFITYPINKSKVWVKNGTHHMIKFPCFAKEFRALNAKSPTLSTTSDINPCIWKKSRGWGALIPSAPWSRLRVQLIYSPEYVWPHARGREELSLPACRGKAGRN